MVGGLCLCFFHCLAEICFTGDSILSGKSVKWLGQVTRGKTSRNRLRRVDIFCLLYCRAALQGDGMFVDIGFGAEPFTTLESAGRFRLLNPALKVLGVEIDPGRVAEAQTYGDPQTFFRLGGFNLPLQNGEKVGLIRAFNVLRQYEEAEVGQAHQTMGTYLQPNGWLIEGTSDPYGQIWVANLLQKRATGPLAMVGLLFSTNFKQGFEPTMFQPVLPKNHIHRMITGELINDFIESWKQSYRETMAFRVWGDEAHFVASCRGLSGRGYTIDSRLKLLNRGYLLWKTASPNPL